MTNADKFNDSYKQAVLKPRDGNALVHEIAKDIKAMMESKISAIKVHNSKTSVKQKKKKNLLKNSNTFLALRIYIYIIYYIAKKKSILAFINLVISIHFLEDHGCRGNFSLVRPGCRPPGILQLYQRKE